MKEENIQNNIENDVLKRIELGELKMKPKSYFVVKSVILIGLTFLTFVMATVLVSFIIFSLKSRGDIFLLGFGTKGLYRFILVFPWYLLIANAFLVFFLDYLLRRFRYGYNSPILYLFLATLVFVTLFSFVVNFTSFHERLSKFAEKNRIPFARDMYIDARKSHSEKSLYRGVVTFIGDNYFILRSGSENVSQKDEIRVVAPPGLDPRNFVHIGEEVYVAGYMATGTNVASFGVHKI